MIKEELSFTKKYFLYLAALEFLVIIFLCVMVYITMNTAPLSWIVSALGAELSIYSGFYCWKARSENKAKYAQLFVAKIADKYGIEMAIKIANVVLND